MAYKVRANLRIKAYFAEKLVAIKKIKWTDSTWSENRKNSWRKRLWTWKDKIYHKNHSHKKLWLYFNSEKLSLNMNDYNKKSTEKCNRNTLKERPNWKGNNNWKKFAIKREWSNFKLVWNESFSTESRKKSKELTQTNCLPEPCLKTQTVPPSANFKQANRNNK